MARKAVRYTLGACGILFGAVTAGSGLLPPWNTPQDFVINVLCFAFGGYLIARSAALFGQSCHRKDF